MPSYGTDSFEIFPRTTRLEVYLFNPSESWVFFKHVSGQPGLMPVYFTKRLVGLFDLAHVRSLIVFFFFVFLLAVTISRRIKLCLHPLVPRTREMGTKNGWCFSEVPHGPCVSHQVSKYLFS